MPGSRPTWYLTHKYVGRNQTYDLQKLQVAPLTVRLFPEGRYARVSTPIWPAQICLEAERASYPWAMDDSVWSNYGIVDSSTTSLGYIFIPRLVQPTNLPEFAAYSEVGELTASKRRTPVFLMLGESAALVYQVLDQVKALGVEVARTARLSASAAVGALWVPAEHGLAEHGLAERDPPGRGRGQGVSYD